MLLLNAAACPSECSQCSQNLFFSSFISIQILFSCLFTSEQIVFITALCNVSSSGQHMYQVPYVFNTRRVLNDEGFLFVTFKDSETKVHPFGLVVLWTSAVGHSLHPCYAVVLPHTTLPVDWLRSNSVRTQTVRPLLLGTMSNLATKTCRHTRSLEAKRRPFSSDVLLNRSSTAVPSEDIPKDRLQFTSDI